MTPATAKQVAFLTDLVDRLDAIELTDTRKTKNTDPVAALKQKQRIAHEYLDAVNNGEATTRGASNYIDDLLRWVTVYERKTK